MARVAVVGAGIGSLSQVYELRKTLDTRDEVVLVGDSEHFEFTPSNSWVAVGWRKPKQITIDLPDLMKKHGIEFRSHGVRKVEPEHAQLRLNDDTLIDYDYLVIATGPKLAFDEVTGLGLDGGHTQSICRTGHAEAAYADFEKLAADPGPIVIGTAPAASCFGPAYEYAFMLGAERLQESAS